MRPLRSLLAFLLVFSISTRVCAVTDVPVVITPIPNLRVQLGTVSDIDLRNFFTIPGITGQIVQVQMNVGSVNLEMQNSIAPATVANFFNYINAGRYENTLFHRLASTSGASKFVLQGGGYSFASGSIAPVTPFLAVTNEYNLSNTRGTVAMAKLGGDPNSATCEWFY